MRMFFGNQYDFNDRNDFVANPFSGSQPNPRPRRPAGGFAFADVNWQSLGGSNLSDLGRSCCRRRIRPTRWPLPLFALSVAQQLLLLGQLQRLLA